MRLSQCEFIKQTPSHAHTLVPDYDWHRFEANEKAPIGGCRKNPKLLRSQIPRHSTAVSQSDHYTSPDLIRIVGVERVLQKLPNCQ